MDLQTLIAADDKVEIYGDHADVVEELCPLGDHPSAPAALGSLTLDFRPGIGINHCPYVEAARLASRCVPVHQMDFADRRAPVLGIAMPATPAPGVELGADERAGSRASAPDAR